MCAPKPRPVDRQAGPCEGCPEDRCDKSLAPVIVPGEPGRDDDEVSDR